MKNWNNNFRKFVYKDAKPHYNWPAFGSIKNENPSKKDKKKIRKHVEKVIKRQQKRLKNCYDISKR